MMEAPTALTGLFFDQLTQTVSDGLLVVDEKGDISSANQAAAAILGYDSDSLVGRRVTEFWQDAPATALSKRSDELPEQMTIKLRHRNGRFVPVTLTISPLAAPQQGQQLLVSITNLENAKQLDETLSHTQRLASIGTLTASVAHELNTPISIIAATCSNLRHEIEDNSLSAEQLARYIEMIEQSAWRSARILEVLRNYSYSDEPLFAVTDLNMIIEDALTLVSHQFRGQHNIEIEMDLAPDLGSIVCDHNRMTQVLLNLLHNASDAIPDSGGTVWVKSWAYTKSEAARQNGRSTPPDEECFAFSITDTGHGIDPEIMPHIFNPFFTTKPHGKGTGLGLYIAKRIVEQHNGRIWADANDQGGATFTIVLPRQQKADPD